jgi:hypothetical protein
MNTRLHAVQHIRRMRGGSQSHLMRASDGEFWVVKYQNNPQHVRILANEMLASRLGQFLGLPIPRVEVIEVSDWLISYTPGLRVEIGETSTPCQQRPSNWHPSIRPEKPRFLTTCRSPFS